MKFQDPWLLLLIPVALGALLAARKRGRSPGLRFPDGLLLKGLPPSPRASVARWIVMLRALSLILILMALARPQQILEESKIRTEGIDIVLTVDVSSSMLAEDFNLGAARMSRIEAAKRVIKDFIRGRKNDRIGMVSFAAESFMVCPLTLDYDWLLAHLDRVQVGMIEDNTALGSGLASALNRLRGTGAKGKAVILLTDGRNNAGKISPEEAAAAARALKIKVYTIGLGSTGPAPYPVMDPFGKRNYRFLALDLDEALLKRIAGETEARYFRAVDLQALQGIFKEIDRLEKVPIEERVYRVKQERFPVFLIPGLMVLMLEMILRRTILRRIPHAI
jgi:Ca-activated chloride channel family protein